MPKIREITTILNQSLKDGNFHGRKFQDGVWYSLAYLVDRNEKRGDEIVTIRRPSIIDNAGEGTSVDYNDTYPIQFYHRITAPLQYVDMNNEGFGNPNSSNKEIADMVLICIGDRARVGAYNEDICAAIVNDLTRELTPTQLTTLALQSATIEVIDTNLNPIEVFEQEYNGVDFALAPENFMISIRYRITTMYGKSCFTLCN